MRCCIYQRVNTASFLLTYHLGFFSRLTGFSALRFALLLEPLDGCLTAGCLVVGFVTSGLEVDGRVVAGRVVGIMLSRVGLVAGLDGEVVSLAGLEAPGRVTGRDEEFSRDGRVVTGSVTDGLPVVCRFVTGLPVLSKDGGRLFVVATFGLFFLNVL